MVKVQRETRITLVRPVNVTEELKRLRIRAGLSMEAISKKLGYKKPSGYQRYENATNFNKKYLPMHLVEKLIPILAGRGEPPIDSVEVLSLGGVSQVVSKALPHARLVHQNAEGFDESRKIPVLEWGKIRMLVKGTLKKEDIKAYSDPGIASPDESFVTEVPDSSMEPEFFQGDRVVCDRSIAIEAGSVVILHRGKTDTDHMGRLKIIDDTISEVVPANPNWRTYRIDGDNPGEIIGKIVEHRRTIR